VPFPDLEPGRKKDDEDPNLEKVIMTMRTKHIKLRVVKTTNRIVQDMTLGLRDTFSVPPVGLPGFIALTDSDEEAQDGAPEITTEDIIQNHLPESRDQEFVAEKESQFESMGHDPTYLESLAKQPSKNKVYHVFQKTQMLKYVRSIPSTPKVRCKYESSYVNLIWHADIHFMSLDNNSMLYAIIDDASRYIVGMEILETKQASSTCKAAKSAMKQYGKPFAFWIDNGGENRGKFKSYLEKYSVHSVFTEAYNPEQNGKIERF
jgi:hypothetical protein